MFTALMKTRSFTLAPEHVMALNLVQVEFSENVQIQAAYRQYIGLLTSGLPRLI